MSEKIDVSTLEDHTNDFVNYVESWSSITDEGGQRISFQPDDIWYAMGQAYFLGSYRLIPEETDIHELMCLDSLQLIPKYLNDMLIRPSAVIPVTLDNLSYWAWTAACISAIESKYQNKLGDVDLYDFEILVHLALYPLRIDLSHFKSMREGESPDPTLRELKFSNNRYKLLIGYPVLEGLICERLPELNGDATVNSTIQCAWKPDRIDDQHLEYSPPDEVHNFSDILQIWRKSDSIDPIVSSVLDSQNRLERYDEETIKHKFGELTNIVNEELHEDNTSNFLRLIGEYRNKNLHGEISTHAISPYLLNLCCLLIWSYVEHEEYGEIRSETIDSIKWGQGAPSLHSFWPASFYPLTYGNIQ